MNYIWKMTNEQWKNYMHDMDIKENEYKKLSSDFNFYGQLYCGDYCIEFIADYADRDGIAIFNYIYQLYVNTGYGITDDGIPYDCTELYIEIPVCNSFDEFKQECENRFETFIKENNLEKYANKSCDWIEVK